MVTIGSNSQENLSGNGLIIQGSSPNLPFLEYTSQQTRYISGINGLNAGDMLTLWTGRKSPDRIAMSIDSMANVGIGVQVPSAGLHIVKPTFRFFSNVAGQSTPHQGAYFSTSFASGKISDEANSLRADLNLSNTVEVDGPAAPIAIRGQSIVNTKSSLERGIVGIYGSTEVRSKANNKTIVGIIADANINAPEAGGSIENCIGLMARSSVYNFGDIEHATAIQASIGDYGEGSIKNAYGLVINDVNQAENNFALVTHEGNISLNDKNSDKMQFEIKGNRQGALLQADAATNVLNVGGTGGSSSLHLHGSLGSDFTSVKSNEQYLLTATDYMVIADAESGSCSIILPRCTESRGRFYQIKAKRSNEGIKVIPSGTDLIEGKNSLIELRQDYESIGLFSDGTEWLLIQ